MRRRVYSFGPFQLDTEEQVLLRDGQSLPLKPKVLRVLAVLVENSGRLVYKDELLRQVWADSFVEEGNLSISIFEIRKALGENANGHKYIETVRRRGYRFTASVTDSEKGMTSEQENGPDVAGSIESVASQGYPIASSGSIAVLPFKFIGGTGNEYLGLGMADALITRLSNLRRVTVRPTSSVRKYSGTEDPVSAGKELGVEWVLDGSVQKSRKRLRVTVQLVGVHDGALKWAEKFDENFTDIFGVEDSISEQVSKALEHKLSGEEKRALGKRFTQNPTAYEAYLKGRYFLDKKTTEGCKKGIDYFRRAIAIDSKYALAYAGIAACHITLNTVLPSREWNPKAESAALRALELDETLAEAHASLGLLRTRQWNWSAGERELKIAIQLKPTYAIARASYAIHLVETGRSCEGIAEIKKALALEPLSLLINSQLGSLLYLSRSYDDALEQFRRTLELDPNFAVARFSLGNLLEVLGRYDDAAREYQVSQVGLGNLPEFTACMARIHALSGNRSQALRSIGALRRLSKTCYVQSNLIALIYTALGQRDEAFDWLERAYAERDEDLCLLKVDPRFDSLRPDPKFTSLLERVGLTSTYQVPSSE